MPKMKTKKSAAKRFRVRAGGSNKRQLRGAVAVHESDVVSVRAMMPYA
jgi:large subunit ribosomal protein L35